VLTAPDGRAALAMLQHHGLPCVVLMDLIMPLMDGWELRAHMLRDPAWAAVPVIVTSAVTEERIRRDELQMRAYFPKPLHLRALLEEIEKYCRPCAAAS
jgi:CheY-like chemotaxis protein